MSGFATGTRLQTLLLILAIVAPAGCTAARSVPPVTAASSAHRTVPEIVVDAAHPTGATVSRDIFGANVGTWFDIAQPFVAPAMKGAGFGLLRFPGGSQSDIYHWQNGGYVCGKNLGYVDPHTSFDNFTRLLAEPLQADVAITLDYGSNPQCNGPGAPSEALGWMARAKQIGANVKYWTLGNEVYGSYEYDLHSHPHSPFQYGTIFHEQFWPAVKHAFPQAKLGLVVGDYWWSWTRKAIAAAKSFDFVEYHYYPEGPVTDDRRLLGNGIDAFGTEIAGLRELLHRRGHDVPIYLGEYNSSYAVAQGKQSVSIVNGLYYGQMLATAIENGVAASSWWLSFGGTNCTGRGDFSSSLYGFQHFGAFTLFSDSLAANDPSCPGLPNLAGGVPFPTARVVTLYRESVPPGSAVLPVRRSGVSAVRAYGYAKPGGGFVMIAFNNTLSSQPVAVRVAGAMRTSYSAMLTTYGAPQYDESRFGRWVGPVSRNLGTVDSSAMSLTLTPYSMTVLELK